MNILLLSWRGPGHPNAGGAEISTHEHAKAWVKAGHSVTLFTSYYQGAKKEETIDGVFVIRRGAQFFGVHWEAFKWYCFAPHLKFDIVIDQFHGIPFFTPLYVKANKLGFIHEITKEVWKLNEFPVPYNFVAGNTGMFLEPLIFKLYKKIPFMTVSDSTKSDLVNWGIPDDNVTIIHNGVNVPLFVNLPQKEKKKTLIYLGALAKDKGIEDALGVFTILNNSSSDWQFWVIGKSDSRYLEKLKAQSGKLKLKGKIKFWGYVDERKKFELLARAHLLINPSIREGWGLVVIEAARMGTPTIAFNVPGLKDSISDGKTGVLCDSLHQMVSEIERLLDDDSRYNEISRNAIIWSKNFSWEKSVKLSLNLIEKLINYKK